MGKIRTAVFAGLGAAGLAGVGFTFLTIFEAILGLGIVGQFLVGLGAIGALGSAILFGGGGEQ